MEGGGGKIYNVMRNTYTYLGKGCVNEWSCCMLNDYYYDDDDMMCVTSHKIALSELRLNCKLDSKLSNSIWMRNKLPSTVVEEKKKVEEVEDLESRFMDPIFKKSDDDERLRTMCINMSSGWFRNGWWICAARISSDQRHNLHSDDKRAPVPV